VTSVPVPIIISVLPNSAQQGQSSLNVTITGQFTNFVNGQSVASFGAGITVNSTTVADATHVTANISILANAAPGARTVTLTTGPEVASLSGGFTVITTGNQPPIVSVVSPGCDFTTSFPSLAQVTFTEYPIPSSNSLPEGITVGPDCNLWFTETVGNK